jgi:hypothetical protein
MQHYISGMHWQLQQQHIPFVCLCLAKIITQGLHKATQGSRRRRQAASRAEQGRLRHDAAAQRGSWYAWRAH